MEKMFSFQDTHSTTDKTHLKNKHMQQNIIFQKMKF